ncbi:MAG: glycoside hydrolase family 2 TIM barrel-domain containing protein [Bacteroidaceae bacterium]
MRQLKRLFIGFLLLIFMAISSTAQIHRVVNLRDGWTFSKDGASVQQVIVPHDWAISGEFDRNIDLWKSEKMVDGKPVLQEHAGNTGSLPWPGKGVYRTTFRVPRPYTHAELLFDGAMSEPQVYVNGQLAGNWACGYNAFRVDATPFLRSGDNTLEVRLNNLELSSRWYPGGGLYRPVHLILSGDEAIDVWGVSITTPQVTKSKATVHADVSLRAGSSNDLRAEFSVIADNGEQVASASGEFVDGRSVAQMELSGPNLWSPESPALYTMVTRLMRQGKVLDEKRTRFGIRSISYTREHGFQLNGMTRKFKGVCLHHDLGPLGAAVNKAAIIRQIRIMKEMGCDAIRTSHNMPSTMMMDLCDSLGMMVMAESFDSWMTGKTANAYNRFFNEWAERDLTNLYLNHRNHPCIVMWSIGNEIPDQASRTGAETCRRLVDLMHRLDPTRPVTAGVDDVAGATRSGYMDALDIPGFNYHTHCYETYIDSLSQGFLIGSETASTLSSRGTYHFPVVLTTDGSTHEDRQVSSYDLYSGSWSNVPDLDAWYQDRKPWILGEFVWTGFDYLGENYPYNAHGMWPSRSSYFGIVDLAGLPKDRYYFYRSRWNTDSHTLHLLPHWTWPGMEGKTIPVMCYTDFPEAELFVNGKSMGRVRKDPTKIFGANRLKWMQVTYEPGELKVIAYDDQGRFAAEKRVHTAGKPARLELTPDRREIKADGDDISFVTVRMLDADGNECPNADHQLQFDVRGAKYQAACNGDASSLQPFEKPQMRLFHGELVVLIRSTRKPADAMLTVICVDDPSISAQTTIRVVK